MSSRRRFVQSIAVALPVVGAAHPRAGSPTSAAPDIDRLRALAEALLPEELGRDGLERAATAFRSWLEGYRPGAEASHGYGTADVEYLPPDPRPAFTAQLEALDAECRRRWAADFGAVAPAQRRDVVAASLPDAMPSRLPDAVRARHVAIALLAWFYRTPQATDLCHRARVGRETCRPLASTREEPPPIGPEPDP